MTLFLGLPFQDVFFSFLSNNEYPMFNQVLLLLGLKHNVTNKKFASLIPDQVSVAGK